MCLGMARTDTRGLHQAAARTRCRPSLPIDPARHPVHRCVIDAVPERMDNMTVLHVMRNGGGGLGHDRDRRIVRVSESEDCERRAEVGNDKTRERLLGRVVRRIESEVQVRTANGGRIHELWWA